MTTVTACIVEIEAFDKEGNSIDGSWERSHHATYDEAEKYMSDMIIEGEFPTNWYVGEGQYLLGGELHRVEISRVANMSILDQFERNIGIIKSEEMQFQSEWQDPPPTPTIL